MSPTKLALLFIIGGILLVFAVMGFSVKDLFRESITEDAVIAIKQEGICIVEASDGIPRQISNCPYQVNETISIKYVPQQPGIQNHMSMK